MTSPITKTNRNWGLWLVTAFFTGFAACILSACAAEVWLMSQSGQAVNQVIFCVVPSSTKVSFEYINPYMSQRIIRPSLYPPCAAIPWSPALPQSGGWKIPP